MNEKLKNLNPLFRRQVEQLLADSAKLGYHLFITSGYRTPEEQDILYAQGRTEPGQIVTNLKGNDIRAMHTKGLAVDLVDERRGYDISWSEMSRLAEKLGIFWGGLWNSFPDKPHFQYMITYRYSVINQSSKPQEEIDKYLFSASSWCLGYSVKLVEDKNNPDCIITFKDGETAFGGAAIQNPKPYAITITIGDEYKVFPNGMRVFQGKIYQNIIHEILHCIFKDNGLGDSHDIESRENIRMNQLNNDVAVDYLFRHIGETTHPIDKTTQMQKLKLIRKKGKKDVWFVCADNQRRRIANLATFNFLRDIGIIGDWQDVEEVDNLDAYPDTGRTILIYDEE